MQQVIIGFDTTEIMKELELSGPSEVDFEIEDIDDEDSDIEDDDEDEDEDENAEEDDYDEVWSSPFKFNFCMNLACHARCFF